MALIENVKNNGLIYGVSQTKTKNNKKTSLKLKPDSFENSASKKENKANNGKFDISQCAKNFAKGILSPIGAIVKHPFMTLGIVALSAAACSLVPVLTPIMGIGFGALSVFQFGKGIFNVAKNIKNKDYDNAEKAFSDIGQGTVGIATSVLGIKQSAKIAKEAKLMNKLGVNSLDEAQKTQIAEEVKALSKLDALKETASLFTSKAGLKAVANQFKPSNITQRAKDMFKFLFTKEEKAKIEKQKMKFKETTEGKRRAALSTDEIRAEVEALYKEVCDEYGIAEELRPKIKIIQDAETKGGCYSSQNHTIEINENSYKAGYFDLADVIKHETTHAKEAILRQRLPLEEKEKIVAEYLLDKIQNGDKENILTGEAKFLQGSVKVKPPKMNAQMKADFSKLAKEKLYQTAPYKEDELIAMVKPIVESNPDYIKGYENIDDALNAMVNYAKNQNFRYRIAMENVAGFNTSGIDTNLLKELSQEEKIAAIKSFKNGIDCAESNAAAQGGILGINSDFNQYQFTPEEVLCQQEGNNFEISKLKEQLNALKNQENYDLAEEARLLDQIKKSELTIEYKTKGQKMFELETLAFNNPDDVDLANNVKMMKNELNHLQEQIKAIQGELTFSEQRALAAQGKDLSEVMDIAMNNPTNEYSVKYVKTRPQTGASVGIPYSTTVGGDILADNLEDI